MAADDLSNTSTNRLRALQYNEKVASLNKQFIKQLQKWMEQTPHYDFTDTVKSYMEHISHLSKLYSINQNATAENKPVRNIAKARRRLTRDSVDVMDDEDKTIPNISTPAVDPPRRSMAFGNVSEIFDANSTPTVSSAPTPSTTRGKRAIRGGGLLGGEEKVIFKGAGGNSESSQDAPSYPAVTINLPKPTPGFWDKKSLEVPNTGNFNFLPKPKNDSEKKDNETSPTKSTEGEVASKPLFFPSISNAAATKLSTPSSTSSAEGAFPFPSSKPAPFTGFNFNSTSSSGATTSSSSGVTGAATTGFGGSASTGFGASASTGFGASSSTGFGASAATGFGAAPIIGFGAAATSGFGGSTSAAPAADGAAEEEYVPPKAEVCIKEEPDSIYSTKCSVFKMVKNEYTKLGVGLMHVKDSDGKKSLLVRAATTIGTVWLNASLNSSLKMNSVKTDEKGDKMNFTVPISSTEMGTFLIRFANKATAEKTKELIEENMK